MPTGTEPCTQLPRPGGNREREREREGEREGRRVRKRNIRT
jgi:hypothetical protein